MYSIWSVTGKSLNHWQRCKVSTRRGYRPTTAQLPPHNCPIVTVQCGLDPDADEEVSAQTTSPFFGYTGELKSKRFNWRKKQRIRRKTNSTSCTGAGTDCAGAGAEADFAGAGAGADFASARAGEEAGPAGDGSGSGSGLGSVSESGPSTGSCVVLASGTALVVGSGAA